MADEKTNPSAERPHRSRKRPPPTIDLPAKEVKAQEAPAGDAPADTQTKPAARDTPTTASGTFFKYAGIGASVAAGVAATLAVLWFASHLPSGGGAAAIRDRLTTLEAQVGAKSNTPEVDPQAIPNLARRLDKLEQAVAKLPTGPQADPALDQRLAGIENSVKSFGGALSAATKRAEDIATASATARERADAAFKGLETIQGRVDALERAAKATQDKVAENSGADTLARRALAIFALRDAAVGGGPYNAELAAAKRAGIDAAKASALEPFANTGIPTDATLAREMSLLLPKLMEVTSSDRRQNAGFIDRLQANAGKLIRIHPIGESGGDDVPDVVARIEAKTARADVRSIASELAKLPPKAREIADAWSKKLAARDAALAAARDLARDAAAALAAH
jgi:hypothetical protein